MLIFIVFCLTSLSSMSHAQDTLYVKSSSDSSVGWPWNVAHVGINNTVDNYHDWDVMCVLPGIYWEKVSITSLSPTPRPYGQLITGWIPDPNQRLGGFPASGLSAQSIVVKSAIKAQNLVFNNGNTLLSSFTYNTINRRKLSGVTIYSDTTVWRLVSSFSNAVDKSYSVLDSGRVINLYFNRFRTDSSKIAIQASNTLSDQYHALSINLGLGQTVTSLKIANMTLQHGTWAAALFSQSNFESTMFENINFWDSYYSEIRFDRANINHLTFNGCSFAKHGVPNHTSNLCNIVFDGAPNGGTVTNFNFNDVNFINCAFSINYSLAPNTNSYAFLKEADSDNTRMININGLEFNSCAFNGPFKSAISIRQDWNTSDNVDPICRVNNIVVDDCRFNRCRLVAELYPPIRSVNIENSQITDCWNGIFFLPYWIRDGRFDTQENRAIATGIFSDQIVLNRNHFTRLGINNAQWLSDTLNYVAYQSLANEPIDASTVVRVKSQTDAAFKMPGYPLRIEGEMSSVQVSSNIMSDIGASAIVIQNTNENMSLSRNAVIVRDNQIDNCIGTNMYLSSSWMTVSNNWVNSDGISHVLFQSIDRLYYDIADSLKYFYPNIAFDYPSKNTYTESFGVSIHDASTWRNTNVREITVTNNTLLNCSVQAILTEGWSNRRVRDVLIASNIIRVKTNLFKPAYVDSVDYLVHGWPTIWISDTDNCQVLNNYAKCDYLTSMGAVDSIWSAGGGIEVDGCDSVLVEGNHFDGLTYAFRLRVDNLNGTISKPNGTTNTNCIIRDNVFSRILRTNESRGLTSSYGNVSIAEMGYQSQFGFLPPESPVAFQGNEVEDNIIQLVVDPGLVPFLSSPMILNHPMIWWPNEMGSGFFTDHSCYGTMDNPEDRDRNKFRGNWLNLLDAADVSGVFPVAIKRWDHSIINGLCQAPDLPEDRGYSLRPDSPYPYPNQEILLGNSWNCQFIETGRTEPFPELGDFPVLIPVLEVPGDLPNLQSAIDYALDHPAFQPRIVVTDTLLSGPGNTDLRMPAGSLFIEARTTCRIDAGGDAGWLSLEPGADLTLKGFRLERAAADQPAIRASQAVLTLVDGGLDGADSLLFDDSECRLEGRASWRRLGADFTGSALCRADGVLDWQDLRLRGPGLLPVAAEPLLQMQGGLGSRLERVVVERAAGVGISMNGGSLELADCRVQDCAGAGLRAALGAVVRDQGSQYLRNQRGMELLGSTVTARLEASVLDDNLEDGLWAAACNPLTLQGARLRGNGGNGLSLLGSDAQVSRCRLEANEGWGILADHSRVGLEESAANEVLDNALGAIRLNRGEPALAFGHNSICGSTDLLLSGSSATDGPWDLQGNFWGLDAPDGRVQLDSAAPQLQPACEDSCTTDSPPIARSQPRADYFSALEHERAGAWAAARDAYLGVPWTWPSSPEAAAALRGLYRASRQGGLDMAATRQDLLLTAEQVQNTRLRRLAVELAARCTASLERRRLGVVEYLALSESAAGDSLALLRMVVILASEAELLGEAPLPGLSFPPPGPGPLGVAELAVWLQDGQHAQGVAAVAQPGPADFRLSPPWPNPFNPETRFTVELPEAARLTLTVHNILGQQVLRREEGRVPAGRHTRAWSGVNDEGRAVASGVYLLSVEASAESGRQWSRTEKLLLVR